MIYFQNTSAVQIAPSTRYLGSDEFGTAVSSLHGCVTSITRKGNLGPHYTSLMAHSGVTICSISMQIGNLCLPCSMERSREKTICMYWRVALHYKKDNLSSSHLHKAPKKLQKFFYTSAHTYIHTNNNYVIY